MKIAMILPCPAIGGHLVSVDPAPALAIPGVRRVLSLPMAVVVLADHTWAGNQGCENARSTMGWWRPDASGTPLTTEQAGNVTGALGDDNGRIDASYELLFLYHATMEPLNVVVELSADRCEVWVGTQSPERAQAKVCSLTGPLTSSKCRHNMAPSK